LLIIIIIIYILLSFFHTGLIQLIGNKDFRVWIWFLPLGVFINGVNRIFSFWRIRTEQFKIASISRVVEAITSSLSKILFGVTFGPSSIGLMVGFLLGITSSLVTLVNFPKRFIFADYPQSFTFNKIKNVANRYKKFPLFATWNVLIQTFSRDVIIFVFSILFSSNVVGYYSLSRNMLQKPLNLISESIQKVYFQKSAQDISKRISIKNNFLKLTFGLFIIGFIPFLLVVYFSKDIFLIIFGREWVTSGTYAAIIAPWFFLLFISSTTNIFYEVFQ